MSFAVKEDRDQAVRTRLAAFGEAITAIEREGDILCVHVRKAELHDVLRTLRDELGFHFLTTCCGMHFPRGTAGNHQHRVDEFGLVYHVHDMRAGHRLRVKCRTTANDLEFATATDLWPAANWMERETWDFFGITFKGHPDLRRILNMEDFPAFPLRKEYPLEDPTRQDKKNEFFGR
ncbi:MAG: NADH-quinone oxidoreductase subunit C [Flavobacteriales bacterium]|jgi:NADH-quinone oxidoreductase subunit C|nr:NADH-quinone oxidoreductase subunit C [Flavobacteriales bacterium]